MQQPYLVQLANVPGGHRGDAQNLLGIVSEVVGSHGTILAERHQGVPPVNVADPDNSRLKNIHDRGFPLQFLQSFKNILANPIAPTVQFQSEASFLRTHHVHLGLASVSDQPVDGVTCTSKCNLLFS